MTKASAPPPGRARRWLSQPFEELVRLLATAPDRGPVDFDVIVVGSGYGGAIAAHHLTGLEKDGEPLSICMLERGDEYLQGMFPTDVVDLPPHVRFTTPKGTRVMGNREALFDVRLGDDVSTVIANGLGGGSLINAGVMLEPSPSVFERDWPGPITWQEMQPYYRDASCLLKANPLAELPEKYRALSAIAGVAGVHPAPVTIATDVNTQAECGACINCGNCVTGCNFGAKISLDVSVLAEAKRRSHTFACYTGAAVERFSAREWEGADPVWEVHVRHTRQGLHKRYPEGFTLSARILIVAAGAMGSTELLMKSRDHTPGLSDALGGRMSTNGDMLAVGFGQRFVSNGIADSPGQAGINGKVGPAITGVVDLRAEPNGVLLQEMNVPFPLKQLFEQVFTTANSLHALGTIDLTEHKAGSFNDPFSLDPKALASTSVYAMMGDDGAKGRLQQLAGFDGEGGLRVEWPDAGKAQVFKTQMQLLENLAIASGAGGRIIANPMWQTFPKTLGWFAGAETGQLLTVHPLGGCPMADSGAGGVVDHLGRVFKGSSSTVYNNLIVLDGAIVPRALGTNPALTISALALRAIRNLSVIWGYRTNGANHGTLSPRPLFHKVVPMPKQETRVGIEERVVGDVMLSGANGVPVKHTVEITLSFAPVSPLVLATSSERLLRVESGRVRVFAENEYERVLSADPASRSVEMTLDDVALSIYEVGGGLILFGRRPGAGVARTLRGLYAWFLNRGMRDICQELADPPKNVRERLWSALALASHAGEVRALEYDLRVQRVIKGEAPGSKRIVGEKRLTYSRAGNPLRQMMMLRLQEFPGLLQRGERVLTLDTRYLARIGVPLVRIRQQESLGHAIADLLAVAGYLLRMVITIHAWTFRLPDRLQSTEPARLPEKLPMVDEFERISLRHPDTGDDLPVTLTRYRRAGREPVMLLHGYSASGTTFAHPALKPSFAAYLWAQGWDVWVVDFRTSPGHPSATRPWQFEHVANEDIPIALEHIYKQTNQKVHVVAHCMGAAMFSMAVLSKDDPNNLPQRWMPDRIGNVVLTQVGPGVVFTPANVFRAYLMNYLRHFFELTRFDFHVDNTTSFGAQLLDRALNLLPYPESEFHIENPLWPPWARTEFVGIRHRMDLLYGRDFSLGNVTEGFLDNINDMFGPLNLDTVSQVIHMTRWKNITNQSGRNQFHLRKGLRTRWRFNTLSVHGRDNGLSSVETLARNRLMFEDAEVPYKTLLLEDYGHQDIWVSDNSVRDVFEPIHRFLRTEACVPDPVGDRPLLAAPPFLGPTIATHPDVRERTLIKLGMSPNLSTPEYLVLLPVRLRGDLYEWDTEHGKAMLETAIFHHPVTPDADGMVDISVTLEASRQWLVLLLYDEPSMLLDNTFGDPALALANPDKRYGPEEHDIRLQDAIAQVLKKPAAKLAPSVVIPPRFNGEAKSFSIAFGSCQYPPGLLDRDLAFASYARLAARIDSGERPDMLLLLGDQVYVDATAGLFDPRRLHDKYVAPYVDWLSDDRVQAVFSKVPAYMMLDDHEVDNDWEPCGEDHTSLSMGEQSFRRFQFHGDAGRDMNKFFGPVAKNPIPVFMLNTRTDRQQRDILRPNESEMMSASQLKALKSWLLSQDERLPKVVTCASVPLPRHLDASPVASDGFEGYSKTFEDLLGWIAEKRIRHVVFLSGDEHLPKIATATLFEQGIEVVKLYSIHTAALYAPIPFANGRPENFLLDDEFAVGPYECRVEANIFTRKDGFTLLNFDRKGGVWSLKGTFDGNGESFTFELA